MARAREVYKRKEMIRAFTTVGLLTTLRQLGLHSFKGPLPSFEECFKVGHVFVRIDVLYKELKKVQAKDVNYSHIALARGLKLSRNGLYCRMDALHLTRDALVRARSVEELQSRHSLIEEIVRRYRVLKKRGMFRAAVFRNFY